MSKTKKQKPEGYVPLVTAIKVIRGRHPWWPETSIRDAIREGQIPSMKASLRRKAKYFVRIEDLEAFVAKLKVEVEPNQVT